jgi:hypothetical protein
MSDNRAARLSRLVDELTEAAKRLGLEVLSLSAQATLRLPSLPAEVSN